MPGLAYFTICSQNYLGYALTLGRSLKEADPDATFIIGLADEWDLSLPREDIEFPVIEAREIGLPTFGDMIIRYSIMEFNTAIKARLFSHLFDTHGYDQLVYLDPDIKVISELTELKSLLADRPSAVLTPHSEAPLNDGKDPDDVRLLRTGAYNLGFAAFTNRPDSRTFLKWWEKRMEVDCRVALDEGLFVDQKFMDLAPCYMDDVRILRHPGYNVAYWNLMHRKVTRTESAWMSAGQPLRFVHFSGVVPGNTGVFSKHQNRFFPNDIGDLHSLFSTYVEEIQANGRVWQSAPYAYNKICGLKLDTFLRRLYARTFPHAMPNARVDAQGLERLANERVGDCAGAQLTRYALEVWSAREDLKAAFDITTEVGREQFARWLATSGRTEHDIDKRFLSAITLKPAGTAPVKTAEAITGSIQNSFLPVLYRLSLPLRHLIRRMPGGITHRLKNLLFAQPRPPQATHLEDTLHSSGVCIFGYFNTESGVGEGARRAYLAMQDAGIEVEARTLQTDEGFLNNVRFDEAQPGGSSNKPVRLYHVNADQTAPDRNWLMKKPTRVKQIGYWAWELSQFPRAWAQASEHLDEIWVPSNFVKASIETAIKRPVVCVPHPINTPNPPAPQLIQNTRERWHISADAFVLLYSFDFNSFISRKNPHGVLDAFERAREGREDLTLVLKVHGNGQSAETRREFLDRASTIAGVIILDQVLTREELDALQWSSDAFISLHRAEGFGLNIAENMAKAKPVIVTDYSGSTDFVDKSVGIPIPFTLTELGSSDYPFGEGQVWAEPNIDAAAEAIRKLYDDRELGKRLGTAGRKRISSKFSFNAVGKIIKGRLDTITTTN